MRGRYGTVESMPNVRGGDSLTFYHASTLAVRHRATVKELTRVAAGSPLVATAQACVDRMPRGHLADVNATLPDGTAISRVWQVVLDDAGGSSAGGGLGLGLDLGVNLTGLLVGIDGWDAGGAVFAGNYLHDSIDGVRWKSSRGKFVGNVWRPAVSATGLEVTPLVSFYEGQ